MHSISERHHDATTMEDSSRDRASLSFDRIASQYTLVRMIVADDCVSSMLRRWPADLRCAAAVALKSNVIRRSFTRINVARTNHHTADNHSASHGNNYSQRADSNMPVLISRLLA